MKKADALMVHFHLPSFRYKKPSTGLRRRAFQKNQSFVIIPSRYPPHGRNRRRIVNIAGSMGQLMQTAALSTQWSIASKHAIRHVSSRSLISLELGIAFLPRSGGAMNLAPGIFCTAGKGASVADKADIHLLCARLRTICSDLLNVHFSPPTGEW